MAVLTLRLFGGLNVAAEKRKLGPAGSQSRPLALLAISAVGGRRGVSRERALLYLWPESSTRSAKNTLNQTVYALKRDLGEPDLFLPGKMLSLNPDVLRCDLWAFEEALALRQLEVAAGIYEGLFLDGFRLRNAPEFESWVDAERSRLGQRNYQQLVTLAERAAEKGNHPNAIKWWREIMSFDPLSAIGAGGLITSLAAAGDRAAAIRYGRDYLKMVEKEMPGLVEPRLTQLIKHLEEAPDATLPAMSESQMRTLLNDHSALERFTRPVFSNDAKGATTPRRTPPGGTKKFAAEELPFQQIIGAIADVIYTADLDGNFTYTNPAGEKLLGLPADEILGRSFLDFVRPDFRHPMLDFYARQIQNKIGVTYYEFPAMGAGPHEVWLGQHVQLVFKNNRPSGILAVARDVTISRNLQDSMQRAAVRDRVTKLVNAAGFRLMLDHRVSLAQRIRRGFLLMFATVENLEEVASTSARGAEAMIRVVAQALKHSFRTSDVVARLGSNQFAMLAIDGRAGDTEVIRLRIEREIHSLRDVSKSDVFPKLRISGAFYDPDLPLSVEALFASNSVNPPPEPDATPAIEEERPADAKKTKRSRVKVGEPG